MDEFDRERRRTAEIAEGRAWDTALDVGTAAEYRSFLQDYPQGSFAETARQKLATIEASQTQVSTVNEERGVLGNAITRLLVEQKLAALGFEPGRVDGRIDDNTRKAVRRFQRAADLQVSGYVTRETIVRLLAAR